MDAKGTVANKQIVLAKGFEIRIHRSYFYTSSKARSLKAFKIEFRKSDTRKQMRTSKNRAPLIIIYHFASTCFTY
jgi:hypothetical protein